MARTIVGLGDAGLETRMADWKYTVWKSGRREDLGGR